MEERVLLLDDDQKMNSLLIRYLEQFGFRVTAFTHPKEALMALKSQHFDIAILDVMLPDMDGFAVCKRIRKEWDLPVVMLTARGELSDKVLGLELGSDDYMAKPFEPRELVARMRAILRRKRFAANGRGSSVILRVGSVTLNRDTYSASLSGRPLRLTGAEFRLLDIFLSAPGQIFSRDILMDRMKGGEPGPFDRSIDILVSRLRARLDDDPADPRFIKTIRGAGYLFMENGS
ncbi:response regulator transcription factor [Sediminispirochaeta bajacaliforniensis]|uniref:response regulator transcription factor n=1 Tax=Sediminispirochaeta bajacaliforniensis TaxID=148 RepID=UPI000360AC04|nr:response regulator transcription factor [Sediminispirochaeta bajacaliforniensis]